MPLRLCLIRHGETEWSLSGQHSGCADISLTARWIGLPVELAQHFLLNTASVNVLFYERDCTDQPVIALWNSAAPETFYGMTDHRIGVARLIVPEHLPPGAPADSDGPKAGGQG